MPHPTHYSDTGAGSERGPASDPPRWVKAFGIAAAVLIVLFAVLHLTGHGLGEHHRDYQPSSASPGQQVSGGSQR